MAAAAIVLFAVDWSSFAISCYQENQYQPGHCTYEQYGTQGGVIAAGFAWGFERKAEDWTAFASLTIALFTLTLWQSSEKLWRASKDALQVTERAFIFLDGFKVELTTSADTKDPIDHASLPAWYQGQPELCITRFAIFPRWKNSGSTPTRKMSIQIDWRGPRGPIPPAEYVYRNPPEPFFVAPGAVELSGVIEISAARALVDWSMSPVG